MRRLSLPFALLLAFVSLGLWPPTSFADPAGSSGAEGVDPNEDLDKVLDALPGRVITLEETIRLAFESSSSLGSARAALEVAEARLLAEKGFYDPEIFADIEVQDSQSPTASVFAGAEVLEDQSIASSLGARTRLSLGTSIEASIESQKSETNDSFRSLDPQYTTFGQVEVRQPLLQGFGPSTRAPLSAAEHALAAERFRLDNQRRQTRADAESRYWELVGAERDFAVQTLVARQAQSVLDQAKVRAEAGLVGPSEVATSEVFLAQQRLALLDREDGLDAASDAVAELIGVRPLSEGRYRTSLRIDDSTLEEVIHKMGSEDFTGDTGDVGEAFGRLMVGGTIFQEDDAFVERALARNSEMRAARADLDALRVREKGARWTALPRLDLVGSIGGNGLSGRGQTIVFGGDTLSTSVDGGLGDALNQSFGLDHRVWSVGLEFRLPLGLRAERGEKNRWAAEGWRQEQQILELSRQTESNVRDALRRIRRGSERLDLARTAVTAAQEQIRIGLIEFTNGRNTAFELVRLGADLASTQREFSQAMVGVAKAHAELRQLMGDGLEGGGLEEDSPEGE